MELAFPGITDPGKSSLYRYNIDFCDAYCALLFEQSAEILSSIFNLIPYDYHIPSESFYKTILCQTLCFAKAKISFESKSGKGYVDFVAETKNDVLVSEVKYGYTSNFFMAKDDSRSQDGVPDSIDSTAAGSTVSTALEYGADIPHADAVHGERPIESPRSISATVAGKAVQRYLDRGERLAHAQIDKKAYARSYLGLGKRVWSVGLSVIDRIEVKITAEEIRRLSEND
ncbi:MAG: hypothetical protein LBR80_06505 [Deltaproteobacteria bacterium]|nr:hypothetical protein [Deltaproteobacteria bacterium]